MKVRSKHTPLQATCLFTDREEPRKAFWAKYDRLKAEIAFESNVHVLSYYGIGGIGKTQLLYQLRREMNEKLENPHHVLVNFETNQDSREVLTALKNLIEQEYHGKVTFPLFELGLYIHSKKLGMREDSPEAKKLTDNLFLNTLMPILGFIPVVSVAASVISAVDQLQSGIGTYIKNNRKELEQLEHMEADELKKHLPRLFAQDLTHSMEHAKEPLVIFMDTYERLVNELSTIGIPLENDLWIRGENGIIQNIPNVLWVIAGREKLKWDIQDPAWVGGVEQHILGNLSFTDSTWFLEKSGVTDSALREQLYELTGGTPMYLDICAGRYHQCIADGEVPDITKFGTNTQKLIERFVRYMDDTQKSIVYMLAFVERWDDALIDRIAPSIFKYDYSIPYKRAKNLSFILRSEDGSYYIHQTVGEVLQGSRDGLFADLRINTATQLVGYYTDQLSGLNPFSPGYAGLLQGLLHAGLLLHQDRNALKDFYETNIQNNVAELGSYGQYDRADAIFDMLWERAVQQKDDLLYATALREWAYLLFSERRDLDRGAEMAAEAVDLFAELVGEEDILVVDAKSVLYLFLHLQKRYEEAIEIEEMALARYQQAYGDDHAKTIGAMSSLATTLYYMKEYQRSAQLAEQVYCKRKALLGEDNPKTLISMSNLAISKTALGEQEEALRLKQEAFAKSLAALGPDHPKTLTVESSLADELQKMKQYDKALPHKHHVYTKRLELLGPDHPDTVKSANQLARTLEALQRYEQAIAYRETVYLHYQNKNGDSDNDTLSYRKALAVCLFYAGQKTEALTHFQAIYQIRRELFGAENKNTLYAYSQMIRCMEALGEKEQVLPHRGEFYTLCRKVYGDTDKTTKEALKYYIYAFAYQGKNEEGLAVCQALYQEHKDRYGATHICTLQLMHYLTLLLLQLYRFEEALELRQFLYQHFLKKYGAHNKITKDAARNLQTVLNTLGRTEEAAQLDEVINAKQPTLAELMELVRQQQAVKTESDSNKEGQQLGNAP